MVTINLDDKAFDGILDKLVAATNDFTPALELMSIQALRAIAQKFRDEGPGWAPLRPKTLQRRARLNRQGPILQVTGKLRNAIVAPQGSPGGIYEMNANSVTIGTNLVYAATHQFGRGPIPARPFLPTAAELIPGFRAKILRYLQDALGTS